MLCEVLGEILEGEAMEGRAGHRVPAGQGRSGVGARHNAQRVRNVRERAMLPRDHAEYCNPPTVSDYKPEICLV